MKKIIAVIAFLMAFTAIQAQQATLYGRDNQTYFEYTTDFLVSSNTAAYINVYPKLDTYTAQSVTVVMDTTGLTANPTSLAVQLQGRYSDQFTTWSNIGSAVTWYLTTADTVMNVLNATENGYKQYRVSFTGTSGATKAITVENFEMQFFLADPD